MAENVRIGDAVRFGWETFGRNVGFLIGVYVAAFVIIGVLEFVADLDALEGFASVLAWILYVLASAVIEMGLIAISLAFVYGMKPEFADLFNRVALVWKYIFAGFLVLLMVAAGLVLFIVPGIFLGIRFSFYGYVIVDEGIGPFDALQKSWDMTQGKVLELFVFYLTLLGINILGVLALVVGILVTAPLSGLATAWVYNSLKAPSPTDGAAVQSP